MKSIVWQSLPLDKTVTQPFGYTPLTVEPILNGRHFHCGIDIGDMPIGQRLHAARAGRVGYVGTGLLAIEATGTGQTDWYIHIDRVVPGVVVGARVARDQLVAYSGNKVPGGGSSTGPHLHFEIQNSAVALVRRFIIGPLGIRIALAIRPGEMNNPATALDPVPVLEGRFAAEAQSITTTEDDMFKVGPRHPKVASLTVAFTGASYRERTPASGKVGDLAKGAVVVVDAYSYSDVGVLSPDLTGAAGAQPGLDFGWWHATNGSWVPDAYLNTSKLVGAPAPAIPATEPMNWIWASREELANVAAAVGGADDDSKLATKDELNAVAAKIPSVADVAKAIAAKLATL